MPKQSFRRIRVNYAKRAIAARRRKRLARKAWRRRPFAQRIGAAVARLGRTVRRITPSTHLIGTPSDGTALANAGTLTRWDAATGSLIKVATASIAQGDGVASRQGTHVLLKRIRSDMYFEWEHDAYSSLLPATGDGSAATKFRRIRVMLVWEPDYFDQSGQDPTVSEILAGLPTGANGQLEPFMADYRKRDLPTEAAATQRDRRFHIYYDRVITFWMKPDSSVVDRVNFTVDVPLFRKQSYRDSTSTAYQQKLYWFAFADRTPSATGPLDQVVWYIKDRVWFLPD